MWSPASEEVNLALSGEGAFQGKTSVGYFLSLPSLTAHRDIRPEGLEAQGAVA